MSGTETVVLKNGAEEAEPLVRVTMMSLQDLMKKDPIGFYELVELCKDRHHKLFGNTGKELVARGLVNGGTVHDSIRHIVLSAVKGEGLDMTLTNPIAPKKPEAAPGA